MEEQIKKIENLLVLNQSVLNCAIADFLSSNKRQDRDRVIRIKARIDVYSELIKMLKLCK